jgi:predicted nucleotidyltransferase
MNPDKINIITSYFQSRPEVVAVYLFGSHAKGKNRRGSDIDLAILLRHDYLCEEDNLYIKYIQALTMLTREDFHLVFMNKAGEGILFQIFKYGKCIVNNIPELLSRFKMTRYSMISDFTYYKERMQKSFIKNLIGTNQ